MTKRVLALIGSPKGLESGNSAALARAITDPLEASKWSCDRVHLHAALRSEEGMSQLFSGIDRADLVLFSMPLYVDSLPAPVIEVLHRIVQHRAAQVESTPTRFFSVVNCGFVDPWQNASAQRMLRSFCRRANLLSVGELSLGAGGSTTKKTREAIALIAGALSEEIPPPERVKELTKRRVIPAFLYIWGGNFMWRRMAKANGVSRRDLKAQPYKRIL